MKRPHLSVIIISHNQKEDLRRCIESVLAQRTSFPMEIIVSDDSSSDGTREMLNNEYSDKAKITLCNTDEYNTHYTFERAGYNRLNGLKSAAGKYVIHVDGDDFFEGDSVFQKQVDILEQHPECSICVQNYKIADIANMNNAKVALNSSIFEGNRIITAGEFLQRIIYVHNSACCLRRECLEASLSVPLDGKTYDDVDITYRYLGYNKVALLDCADFVYVQNPNSFCHTNKSVDWSIISASGLQGIRYVPHLAIPILKTHYQRVWALAKMAWKRVLVTDSLIDYFKDDNMFIFKVFDNRYKVKHRMRVLCILFWLIPVKYWGVSNDLTWKVLFKLAI